MKDLNFLFINKLIFNMYEIERNGGGTVDQWLALPTYSEKVELCMSG